MFMNVSNAPRQTAWGRCSASCPEVQRETCQAEQLRALIARMLDYLPADAPLADEARLALE